MGRPGRDSRALRNSVSILTDVGSFRQGPDMIGFDF